MSITKQIFPFFFGFISNGPYTPPLPSPSTRLSTHTSHTAHPSTHSLNPSVCPVMTVERMDF